MPGIGQSNLYPLIPYKGGYIPHIPLMGYMSAIAEKINFRQKEAKSISKVTQQIVVMDVESGVGRMSWSYCRQGKHLLCLRPTREVMRPVVALFS